jgi:hypothetical protein
VTAALSCTVLLISGIVLAEAPRWPGILTTGLVTAAPAAPTVPTGAPVAPGRTRTATDITARVSVTPRPVYGLTVDDPYDTTAITATLKTLPRSTTTRVVFDEDVPASQYTTIVPALARHTTVMGELLDSAYVAQTSTRAYTARAREYVAAFGGRGVDVFEVGNEINGEWLGDAKTVAAKVTAAYDVVDNAGHKTAITLYYNPDSWEKPGNEMWRWTAANLPERVRSGVDVVYLSWYERDNGNQRFTTGHWAREFARLSKMFPHAAVGFGEIGWSEPVSLAVKQDMMRRFYLLTPHIRAKVPAYVGGYFWWNGSQDLIGRRAPLLPTFTDVLSRT